MSSPLSDLDELVLKCRNKKAKNYIREAVACYKSSAFRSAIVSTWIAVSFDIIDKIRDLTLAGDKEAEKQLEQFDKAREANDLARSLQFEREILKVARDKLELISQVEYIDLERLQQDRNRCAHPTMTSDGEIFNPSAELARVHIRCAIDHLLQYPPAQGKYALSKLLKEVDSNYFPVSVSDAFISLTNSPLAHARDSLVRNFIIILLKKLLMDNKDYQIVRKLSSALKATENMHSKVYFNTLQEKLSVLFKLVPDEELYRTFPILQRISDSWQMLSKDIQQKLCLYVKTLPGEYFDEIGFLLEHDGLKEAAQNRVSISTTEEVLNDYFFILPAEIVKRIVELYTKSGCFAEANSLSKLIITNKSFLTKNQVKEIIKACGINDQIKNSSEVGNVINALRQHRSVTDEEVDNWLKEVELLKYLISE